MKAWQITQHSGLDALKLKEFSDPKPQNDQILVKIKANSMNYRDLSMPHGGYPRNDKVPLIPLSDGAGQVIAVGERVDRFQVGDRVAGCFFQRWSSGELTEEGIRSALGGAIDGVLSEYAVFAQDAAVKVPDHLSYEEAACLPCAALTAWNALTGAGIKAGDSVLLLGTGGVSIFGLQFAKAFGARVIITSSSDAKLERAKELGADELINYKTHPEWEKEVLRLTGGRGVDNVLEVGGVGTLARSLSCARIDGSVSLIGVLTGNASNPSPLPVLFNRLTLQGIYVGNRSQFEDMNRAIAVNRLRPVIDQRFAFDQVPEAYLCLKEAGHFGKIVITH